jgi:hypothetical protein
MGLLRPASYQLIWLGAHSYWSEPAILETAVLKALPDFAAKGPTAGKSRGWTIKLPANLYI